MRFAAALVVLAVVCAGAALVLGAGEGDKPAPLVFKNHGFSIAPLDETGKGAQQVLMMFLPASDGFAPNVNVQAQEYADTMEAYVALSKSQVEQMKLKVISDKLADGVATMEYSGEVSGRQLHWYVRAAKKGGTVYLVTATALESQWKNTSAKLKACVDSFQFQTAK